MGKKMITKILIAIAVLGLVAFVMRGRSDIDSPKAHALVEAGAQLVDVRSPAEFAGGHIEGAVNIPVGELSARMGELGNKSTPIVVYCRSGMRAGSAQKQLQAAGFEQVHNLGSMSAWK